MEKDCKGKQRWRENRCLDILFYDYFLNQQCWCFYLFAPSLRRRGQQHRGYRLSRWHLKQSCKPFSVRKQTRMLNTHSKLDICIDCQTLTEEHLFTVFWRGSANRESLWPSTTDRLVALRTGSPGPGMHGALAMPTICPWMAVPSTAPRTSTVIPEEKEERKEV